MHQNIFYKLPILYNWKKKLLKGWNDKQWTSATIYGRLHHWDAIIPGHAEDTWGTSDGAEGQCGVFYGQCAEICGTGHGFMPIVVEVISPKAYQNWIYGQITE